MHTIMLYSILSACIASSTLAGATPAHRSRVLSGGEDAPPLAGGQVPRGSRPSALDLTGEAFVAGTTWYDYQHNGTVGRMIGVDDLGFVHVVWMNGLNESLSQRHVYYNVWDPVAEDYLIPDGAQVDFSTRAGYTNVAVTGDGFAFPVFHQFLPNSRFRTAAGVDFLPRAGAFFTTILSATDTVDVGWPKVAMSGNENLHAISTSSTFDQFAYLYSRGTRFGEDIEWQAFGASDVLQIGSGIVIASNIAASRNSDRVAVLWHQPRSGNGVVAQTNNNLQLSISEDGGLTWADPLDVTQWAEPDFDCLSGDTLACNGDTLRPYVCNSILFDESDVIHVAFTTRVFYEFAPPGGILPTTRANMSGIWHWSENFQEYSPVANAYYYATASGDTLPDATYQTLVQRPSLSCDALTGELYCSYMKYDSTQWSWAGWMMADVWVTKSENQGRVWKQGVNVTDTDGGPNAPAGQSLHERDANLAPLITYDGGEGVLHLLYVLDYDAGSMPHSEGIATECDVIYQRIAVSDLDFGEDLEPLWPTMHVDSSGLPGRLIPLEDECFAPDSLTMTYDSDLSLLRLSWARPPFGCQCFRLWWTGADNPVFPDDYMIERFMIEDSFVTVPVVAAAKRTFVVQTLPCP